MDIKKRKLTSIIAISLLTVLILFVSAIFYISEPKSASAAVLNNTNSDILTNDLLLSDYTTRGDGSVFNGNVLLDIYKRVTGNENATYANIETDARNTSGKNTNITMHSGKDAKQIKTNNKNKNIVVTLGGMQWMVTSLTTNDSNEPVLTLWLKDNGDSSVWSTWTPGGNTSTTSSLCYTYSSNIYSSSYIRARLLNGKDADGGDVKYVNSAGATSLTQYTRPTDDGGYNFDIFAHRGATGSITRYLVQPKNIPYQGTEDLYHLARNNDWYNVVNDSYKKNTTSSKFRWPWYYNLQDTPGYGDWGDDYIWLPSFTETGWNSTLAGKYGNPGLWNMSGEMLGTSSPMWYRTGSDGGTNQQAQLTNAYLDFPLTLVKAAGVRPCIHLNLKEANDASQFTFDPSDVNLTYDGTQKDISGEDWYDGATYGASSIMTIDYADSAGVSLGSDRPLEAGNYKVRLTLLNTTKYAWQGVSGAVKEINFKIQPKSLRATLNSSVSPPTVTPNSADLCDRDKSFASSILRIKYTDDKGQISYDSPSKVGTYTAEAELNPNVATSKNYNLADNYSATVYIDKIPIKLPTFNPSEWYTYDSTEQTYILNYDSNEVEVELVNDYDGAIKLVGTFIQVTKAGEYKDALKAHLKRKYNASDNSGITVWDITGNSSEDQYLSFEIKKKELQFTIDSTDGVIEGRIGEPLDINVRYVNNNPYGSDVVNYVINATMLGTTIKGVGRGSVIKNKPAESISLEISKIPLAGNWELSIEVEEGESNYTVKLASAVTLKLIKASGSTDLVWWFTKDGKDTYETVSAKVGQTSVTFEPEERKVYGKVEYGFYATAPDGYEIDEDYNQDGFVGGYKDSVGINAGEYRTQVRIKKNGETNGSTYEIVWEIDKAKFDLTNVKWVNNGKLPYNGGEEVKAELDSETLPSELKATYSVNVGINVGEDGRARVVFSFADPSYENNYVLPVQGDLDSYIGSGFEWEKDWEVTPAEIKVGSPNDWKDVEGEDEEGNKYTYKVLADEKAEGIVEYVYFETDSKGNVIDATKELSLEDIHVSATERKYYVAYPKIKAGFAQNYKFPDGLVDPTGYYSQPFTVGGGSTAVQVTIENSEYEYNNGKEIKVKVVITGSAKESDLEMTYYKGDIVSEDNKVEGVPKEVGKYTVVISVKNGSNVVLSGKTQYEIEITKAKISKEWNKNAKPYVLNLKYGQIKGVEYEIQDLEGNVITDVSQLVAGNTYKIKAKIKDTQNYIFADDTLETDWEEFEVREDDVIYDPNDPNNPNYPQTDPDDPNTPVNPDNPDDTDKDGNGGALDEILAKIKDLPLWQLIASGISIILTIAFLSKTASNESKRKKAKKVMEKKYNTFYATAFLGISVTNWTVIASVLMGTAVLSLIFMIISQKRRNKAEEELEDAKEEYERNKEDEKERRRDEDMKMMFMHMMGGNGNMQNGMGGQGQPQGFVYQSGIGAEEMKGMISEVVTALLPGVQQMIPQQASANDERIEQLMKANEDLMRNQEILMKKLSEQPKEKEGISEETLEKLISKLSAQQPVEKVIEREIASGQTVEKVIQVSADDEKMNMLMRNQEEMMKQMKELAANKNTEKEVIEKIVEVPVEKIVEKEIVKEVKVEVPVEVEKIVEKEVPVEKIVEVPIEVEKVVEKIVEIPAAKPAPKAKTASPRLTLDEAYAKLSAKQKKFFDTLKEYAMSKDKCKEKKSTYYILLGQSSVNPLVKLTIKKDCTVALFKMEDEYMKDIRRNAGSEGTKVKVKETELIVGDSQALATAKEMIDLREDQIERYNDFLKEQRSMRNK